MMDLTVLCGGEFDKWHEFSTQNWNNSTLLEYRLTWDGAMFLCPHPSELSALGPLSLSVFLCSMSFVWYTVYSQSLHGKDKTDKGRKSVHHRPLMHRTLACRTAGAWMDKTVPGRIA